MPDFDRLVALETKLAQEPGEIATVERHDFGLGKFNIFALTEDPATAFTKAHRIESFRKRFPSAHSRGVLSRWGLE